jgi:hypothetical protein
MCGTMVKPRRTKRRLVGEGAQRRETIGRRAAGDVVDERRSDVLTAHCLVHHQRPHFRRAAAERRELDASDDAFAACGDGEAGGVRLEVVDRARGGGGLPPGCR